MSDVQRIREAMQAIDRTNPGPEVATVFGVLALYEIAAQLAKLNAFIEAGVFDREGDPR